MLLSSRRSRDKLVKPASAEMSDMLLSQRSSQLNLIADSIPVKSLMDASVAPKIAKVTMFPRTMEALDGLPRAVAIAARRLGAGMLTSFTASRRSCFHSDVSHSSTMPLLNPEASVRPSGENDTEVTEAVCPRVTIFAPVSTSHNLTVPPPEARIVPSGENDTEWT